MIEIIFSIQFARSIRIDMFTLHVFSVRLFIVGLVWSKRRIFATIT